MEKTNNPLAERSSKRIEKRQSYADVLRAYR